MVAYHSFGSRRATEAMREVYPRPRPDDPADAAAASAARTRSGWAIAERLFPGRVYDHTCACPLFEKSHLASPEVWVGEFGDTVMCMVPSNAENQRRDRRVGEDRPVRVELVVDMLATLRHVDQVAGTRRFVEVAVGATRGAVLGSARGEPLEFESPFLDGPADAEFPRLEYLTQARRWLFGLSLPPRLVPPAATVVRGYLLAPVGAALPLADGRPVVHLPPPDELAARLAGADMLDEHHGRYVTGGGDWFQLHRLDADRALLVGCDVEDTETFFAAGMAMFGGDDETDLLAGVPKWWGDLLHTRHPGAFTTDDRFDPVNVVFGWDGHRWTKAIGAPDPGLLHHFLDPDDT
ncbi:hypothetical protein BLA60_18140 [Actinophytocola xinjiangensis]|uniref:Uncharacterized protein n=1 Tax=Actinophytocola xinjiangensis TaxID=485602 RepID=A0A7Z0WMH5_9PSEU|nr:hypothetical protein [Actinophytocola xinjiangensis]OLF09710.1 hypothetical protein BLA60_18140 [Actinophytocola xinjiangensis]